MADVQWSIWDSHTRIFTLEDWAVGSFVVYIYTLNCQRHMRPWGKFLEKLKNLGKICKNLSKICLKVTEVWAKTCAPCKYKWSHRLILINHNTAIELSDVIKMCGSLWQNLWNTTMHLFSCIYCSQTHATHWVTSGNVLCTFTAEKFNITSILQNMNFWRLWEKFF